MEGLSPSRWESSTYINIADAKLGVLNWILRACAVAYMLLRLVHFQEYRWNEQAAAIPTFWFDRKYAVNGSHYCNNVTYDYNYVAQQSYWNDRNMSCEAMCDGQVMHVDPAAGFAATFVKRQLTTCPAVLSQGSCTYGAVENLFALGVDDLVFSVHHRTTTSMAFGNIQGSSVIRSPVGNLKPIRTCIRRSSMNTACNTGQQLDDASWPTCCFRIFDPGENINLTIKEWLNVAGVSLDERASGVEVDAVTGLKPFRRSTGVRVSLHMSYFGDALDTMLICEIVAEVREGWSSFGVHNIFSQYRHSSSDGGSSDSKVYGNFKRGVRFEFQSRGRITKFNYGVLIETIVSGLVLLRCVPHVMEVVAKYCVAESATYRRAIKGRFSYDWKLAEFAVKVALTCQSFAQWDIRPDEFSKTKEPELSREELEMVFRDCKAIDSRMFADVIVGEMDRVTHKHAMTCRDLVSLVGNELVSVEQLVAHAELRYRQRSQRYLASSEFSESSLPPQPPLQLRNLACLEPPASAPPILLDLQCPTLR